MQVSARAVVAHLLVSTSTRSAVPARSTSTRIGSSTSGANAVTRAASQMPRPLEKCFGPSRTHPPVVGRSSRRAPGGSDAHTPYSRPGHRLATGLAQDGDGIGVGLGEPSHGQVPTSDLDERAMPGRGRAGSRPRQGEVEGVESVADRWGVAHRRHVSRT